MLEPGGLLDQPAGLWINVQHAGGVWAFLGRMRAKGFDVDSLTAGEKKLWGEILDIEEANPDLLVIEEEEEPLG